MEKWYKESVTATTGGIIGAAFSKVIEQWSGASNFWAILFPVIEIAVIVLASIFVFKAINKNE